MSSAKNQRGINNITSSNNNNNNQHITTESFIPGIFYKVVYYIFIIIFRMVKRNLLKNPTELLAVTPITLLYLREFL